MDYNVAIIGAGLIGRKRALALSKFKDCRLKVVVDIDEERAEKLADSFNARVETNWESVIKDESIDIIIVSTVNKFLAPITTAGLKNGKHVLCEKPLGRNPSESKKILRVLYEARSKNKEFIVLKTGFNHRHHPAIFMAKELLDNGKIGKLYFMRCRYGHGGRPGYEKEWRADKELCGGGELLDQGVHVVDLFRWFATDFNEAFGYINTYFWNMEVEDNAFALFKNKKGIVASMHTSWTQWKNLFSFEIFGSHGYLIIEGLGRSYGIESLRIGKRKPEGGVPEEKLIKFSDEDISWEKEWEEFLSAVKDKREPLGNGIDGHKANCMIKAVYESSYTRNPVGIIYE